MNIYGYCRISTAKQSIDRQIRNIKAEYPTAHIVQEAYTGTSIFRPEWLTLYRILRAGDVVVFDSVSRMSRNAEEGFALYDDLYHKGIRLVFLKEHHIDTETYKKALSGSIAMTGTNVDFILKGINEYLMALAKEQIKLAFEQSEKEVADLHQRTREGLLTARLNGKQVGRKKGVGFETKKAREAKQIIDINQTMSPEHICKALSPEFESLVIRHNLYRKAVASDLITPKIYDGCIEDSYDTAYGLSEIISKGYRLGPTQAAILTDAIKSRVDCRETSLRIFPSILEELENSSLASARTLANRLRPLLRNNVFECQKTGSTSLPLSPNIHVFDLSGYPAGIRIILAELLLYDWFRSARALQTPIIIMVDEVQNLKLGRGTVLNQIITEGRRFSIGSTLISQSLKAFSPDEQLALSQTGTKLFFKPPLTELRACSEMLAPPQHRAETAELLKTLKAGQCLLLSEYVYIGDETHPCTDCIQVNVDLPQSVK